MDISSFSPETQARIRAQLVKSGAGSIEEWNAQMAMPTSGGYNQAQRASGHDTSESTGWRAWTPEMDQPGYVELRPGTDHATAVLEAQQREAQAMIAARLAERGRIPSIDVGPSISTPDLLIQRVVAGRMPSVSDSPQGTFSEEAPVSWLSSLLGTAKNVITSPTGQTMLTAGAQQILDSRRDNPTMQYTGDPPQIPGGPQITQAGIPWGTVGQTIGKVATTVGTALTGAALVGSAYQAAFPGKSGLGAVSPKKRSVSQSLCPKGYCLAIDGMCYPKSMLPRGFRKWKPEPRPVVSRSDQKAIRRAAGAKKRLVKITKDAGAWASVTKPHHHATGKGKK